MSDFFIKQGDTSPAITAQLTDADGTPIDLTGADVRFHMATRDKSTVVDAVATITDAANGQVRYAWATADTDTAGRFLAEFEVTHSDGSVETFPNTDYITVTIEDDLA